MIIGEIEQQLLKDRIIIINESINDAISTSVIKQLLYLSHKSDNDIWLYINSGGGSVSAGMAIVDTINYINCDICTLVFGIAASMGAVLLSSGTIGKRYALPNAEIMLHSASVDAPYEKVTDLIVHAKQFEKLQNKMMRIIAYNTNQPVQKIKNDLQHDLWLNAHQALNYGLIDKIIR